MKRRTISKKIHFCIGDQLATDAAEAAAAESETLSAVVRLALRQWLASRNQPPEYHSA